MCYVSWLGAVTSWCILVTERRLQEVTTTSKEIVPQISTCKTADKQVRYNVYWANLWTQPG